MTITTNTTDRKALAKAIAEELGTTARYMGMPGCGYQVGDYVVDRDGNITGENFEALRDFLTRNGYELPDQERPQRHSLMTSSTRKRLLIRKRSPLPRWTFRFRRGMLR